MDILVYTVYIYMYDECSAIIDFICIEYILVGAMVKKSEDPFSKEGSNNRSR